MIAASICVLIGLIIVEGLIIKSRRAAKRKDAYLWTEALDRVHAQIRDPERMTSIALVRERLVGQQAYLDMICRSTAVALASPRSVITLIDAASQTFIAHHAVDTRERLFYEKTEVPLSSTYCQFTVASNHTLVIQNAKRDILVKDNPCTTELGMRAYLGTPIHSLEGFPVGSLCVFDFEPRKWSARDIAIIESFAALVAL